MAMQPVGPKSAPLGYQALSTAIVKSQSTPTLHRPTMGKTGGAFSQQSQALMSTGALMTLSGSADGKLSGRTVSTGCWGDGPKKSGVFKKNLPKNLMDKSKTFEAAHHPATQFRRFYERSDLPIAVRHGTSPTIDWKVEPERLDYIYLLPIFFDGLIEKENPYSFLAYKGLQDFLRPCRAIPGVLVLFMFSEWAEPFSAAAMFLGSFLVIRVDASCSASTISIESWSSCAMPMPPFKKAVVPVPAEDNRTANVTTGLDQNATSPSMSKVDASWHRAWFS
eukprot:s3277_g3.t1